VIDEQGGVLPSHGVPARQSNIHVLPPMTLDSQQRSDHFPFLPWVRRQQASQRVSRGGVKNHGEIKND
jgi:hypothetical protein